MSFLFVYNWLHFYLLLYNLYLFSQFKSQHSNNTRNINLPKSKSDSLKKTPLHIFIAYSVLVIKLFLTTYLFELVCVMIRTWCANKLLISYDAIYIISRSSFLSTRIKNVELINTYLTVLLRLIFLKCKFVTS